MAALSINVFENPAVFDNLSDYPDLVDTVEVVSVEEISPIDISVFDASTTSENLSEGGVLNVNLARSGVRIV